MPDAADPRERLRRLLRRLSYREGTFRLTSGRTSPYYIDGKQTTLSAEGAYLCGRLLFERLAGGGAEVAAVGGVTLGADPLVTAVAVVSHLEGRPLPAFIIRKRPKGHGTGSWIEGKGNIPEGSPVALLEDVVTTGGTLLEAVRRTEAEGYRVARVLTVVDRGEGGAEALAAAGHRLEALFTLEDLRRA
ncbi:orotate phosphoribosyltransferase [Dissulfurirhabdus thermomarina]|uniref:Orotate phosphoribosyltransferase n=1 Tax=Dissulfurirhabdus thermomarina TaxID=1765737 RepID=A0A6N9TUB8_DISTH|nr:orotate phosphoribosyltransferase [Dissulfurirhabdus thermomarina]NDY42096.1 orotate phosphoribosyltransferase [Dissulfurirhabdus thermomarina]NMX22492.1 orotate phosphoribosyltransferase [Dissulfurirhabdus thermomarina]